MKISTSGIELIKSFEGLHEIRSDGLVHSYQDPVGVWTIGYGHTEFVVKDMSITVDQAEMFLTSDLKKFEEVVNKFVLVDLSQNQFDALVSFVFNIGARAFKFSTLRAKLNDGDYKGASKEFKKWNRAGKIRLRGLTRRRKAESNLFLA